MTNRKKITIGFIILVAAVLIVAACTKPSDKKIKIQVVHALWGKWVPSMDQYPAHYEEFMNEVTKDIDVEDWLFFKRIKDTVKDSTFVVGYAAFGKVIYK